MNSLSFILGLLSLVSVDIMLGFLIFILYKYVDLKYFSNLEIEQLKEENQYLREENKKVNGSNSFMWGNE